MVLTLGLVTAIALVVYPYVHRRRVRGAVVSRVRREIGQWITRDLATPQRPIVAAPSAAMGTTPQGSGASPDLLAPAARRQHFVLTQHEIEHWRVS